MTEEDAREWVQSRCGTEATDRLAHFATLLTHENKVQNLVSAASLAQLWSRHIVDSAQLALLAPEHDGNWLDVGTGGGFPGLVVACLRQTHVILVEPRHRRADFLTTVVHSLGLANVKVHCARVEQVEASPAIISARAVAAPAKFFELTRGVASTDTIYLLPSGRNAEVALAEAKRHWSGVFHVEHSVTDPTSGIIVARNVRRR